MRHETNLHYVFPCGLKHTGFNSSVQVLRTMKQGMTGINDGSMSSLAIILQLKVTLVLRVGEDSWTFANVLYLLG